MQRIYCLVLVYVGFGDETRVDTLCLHRCKGVYRYLMD